MWDTGLEPNWHGEQTGELTEDEVAELDRFGELEHLMQLVKARAQVYMESQT